MNLEDLSLKELEDMAVLIKDAQTKRASQSIYKHFGSQEDMSMSEHDFAAAEIKNRQYEDASKVVYKDYGSLDQMSDAEISHFADMVKHVYMQRAQKSGIDNYGSYDKMSSSEISSKERETKFYQEQYAVSGGNDSTIKGNVESVILDGDAEHLEAMQSQLRREHAVSGGNDSTIRGNVESAILDGDVSHLEYAVMQQKMADADPMQYFNALNENPQIADENTFKSAVSRSIQSNRIINNFFEGFVETLSSKLALLKNIDTTNNSAVRSAKENIEKYLNIYSRFLFELKIQEAAIDYRALQFPDDIKEDLWQAQKRLGVTFEMPIPAKFNGREPFELNGDAISVINCMNGFTKGYQGRILSENILEQEMENE